MPTVNEIVRSRCAVTAKRRCVCPVNGFRHNPYAPGAGLQPPELAGRDKLIEDAATDLDRLLDSRPAKGMLLLGLRGVGKTVLLNRLHHMADDKGIHTAKIEAPEGGTLPESTSNSRHQKSSSISMLTFSVCVSTG